MDSKEEKKGKMTMSEEIACLAKNMDTSLSIKKSMEPAYNPNYVNLVRFKNAQQRETFDRLPLTEKQKEVLVYDHIGVYAFNRRP